MLKTKTLNYEKIVKDLSKQNNEPSWLLDKRLKALKIFLNSIMPRFVYGINMDLNIDLDLDKINIENTAKQKSKIEIKNSSKDIKIFNLQDMLKNHENIVKEKFMSSIDANKFTSFHNAFLKDIIFIYAPKNINVKEPIEITAVNSGVDFEHIIIIAENNASLSVISKSGSSDKASYRSKIVEIFAADNTTVNYNDIQLLSQETSNFTIKRAIAKENSSINWLDLCFGSKTTLSGTITALDGENSNSDYNGLFFSDRVQKFDIGAHSIHTAPNTISKMNTKGITEDSSKTVSHGSIVIKDNAKNSDAKQKHDVLVLGKNAVADAIPNLEIDNHDVKCAHGASIGRIDKEKLFYMESRGLCKELAIREYAKGFFNPILNKIQYQKLKDNIREIINKKIKVELKCCRQKK